MRLSRPFLAILFFFEVLLVIGFGFATNYAPGVKSGTNETAVGVEITPVDDIYPLFQDVQVMVFVGFGFLMTFLKKYGFSAVGLTFLIAAFVIQLGILVTNFFHQAFEGSFHTIQLEVSTLVTGEFAAASLLIAFGSLLGKASSFQILALAFVHIIAYSVNEAILVTEFGVLDVGGSMVIHAFGAYFGLAASWVLGKRSSKHLQKTDSNLNGSVYHSDLFAMIGTLFLWMFWPSFNGALTTGSERHRVVLNTVLSLCGSCLMAFITSGCLRKKFNMVDVQNATLAGGVAIGAVANFNLGPAVAICMGILCGFVSVLGYVYVSPLLNDKAGIDDTCGVNNLHGMPGIISAIASIIASAAATRSVYGDELDTFFNEEPQEQARRQLYSLLCTLAISIVGGLVGGFFISFIPELPEFYSDAAEWDLEEGEETPEGDPNSFPLKRLVSLP